MSAAKFWSRSLGAGSGFVRNTVCLISNIKQFPRFGNLVDRAVWRNTCFCLTLILETVMKTHCVCILILLNWAGGGRSKILFLTYWLDLKIEDPVIFIDELPEQAVLLRVPHNANGIPSRAKRTRTRARAHEPTKWKQTRTTSTVTSAPVLLIMNPFTRLLFPPQR